MSAVQRCEPAAEREPAGSHLLGSELPLAAADLLAAKKSPVSGTFTVVFAVAWVLALIFLVYTAVKRRR